MTQHYYRRGPWWGEALYWLIVGVLIIIPSVALTLGLFHWIAVTLF